MVRLKQRFILFDILYPPKERGDETSGFSQSPQTALLGLHRSSPSSVNPKTITNAIRQVIQEYYGDYGSSFAMQLNLKYFNNKTSSGIIRSGRQNYQFIIAALTLINQIEGNSVIIRCRHVSGTIKKCEEKAIDQNRELMVQMRRAQGSGLHV